MINSNLNNKFYALKAICLVSIVCAHSAYTSLSSDVIKSLINAFISYGVYGFLILSAYFFAGTKRSFKEFWLSKVNTIFIPWFIAGFINYLKGALHQKYFSIFEMINYTIGNRSYLYYLSILVICYLLFWNFRKINKIQLIICLCITVISRTIYSYDLLDNVVLLSNSYLNPLNYLGIFALGIYMRNCDLFSQMDEYIKKNNYLLVISLLALVISSFIKINVNWYSHFSWMIDIIFGFILAVGLSFKYLDKSQLCVNVGQYTMPIYLYHLLLINHILTNDFLMDNVLVAILRPIITVLLMYIALSLLNKIAGRNQKLKKIYCILSGIRK